MIKKTLSILVLSSLLVNANDIGFALTSPVGIVRSTIAASTDGIDHAATMWAPTLFQHSELAGKMAGKITSVSNATITVADAGWESAALINKYLYIQSGNLSGALLRIVSNDANTISLDDQTLNQYGNGLAQGNGFQIINPYTISGILGDSDDGVVGGSLDDFRAGKTDRVVICDENTSILRTYYFDTDFNYWRDPGSDSNESQNNVVIPSMAGAVYYRISQDPYELIFTGNVPTHGGLFLLHEGAISHSRFYPTSTTLDLLGLHLLPQWRKSNVSSVSFADRVMVQGADGIFRSYWHNGEHWVTNGSDLTQNDTAIREGASFFTVRTGKNPPTVFLMPQPY